MDRAPEARVNGRKWGAPGESLAGERWPSFGERALAAFLLLLCTPVLALVMLAVLLSDGRPVLFRSRRLGRWKRPFDMFKIRTLRRGAHLLTGARLLKVTDGLAIRGGQFLRDTRLDELPQLWNIVRGEMAFVGPRPERPEVYEHQCRGIGSYDRRFTVPPGLIGIAQLFTPHSTDKRYRTLFESTAFEHRPLRDLRIVAYTVGVVLRKSLRFLARNVWVDILRSRILGQFPQRRRYLRVGLPWAEAHVLGSGVPAGRLVDINEEAFRVEFRAPLAPGEVRMIRLRLELGAEAGPPRVRTADCTGRVARVASNGSGCALVVKYEPNSARSRYVLDQYFLRSSLAYPGSNGRQRRLLRTRSLPSLSLPALREVSRQETA